MLIDTHCHLSINDYTNLDEIVKEMNGIIIASGCDDKSNLEVIDLVNKYGNVYGTLGFHPEEINNLTKNSFKIIEDNLNNPKIVAIGEIGLDYYWVKDNKDNQIELFKKQLLLAEKYNKPVVIHSREAIQDTYDIVKQYDIKGDIHAFNGSLEMANEFIKIGFKLGVGGVLTFKNATKIQDVISKIDLSNLLLETDSPYLSPEPFRGKQNKPSNVYYVALKLSELKGISVEEVINITTRNAIEEFDLKV